MFAIIHQIMIRSIITTFPRSESAPNVPSFPCSSRLIFPYTNLSTLSHSPCLPPLLTSLSHPSTSNSYCTNTTLESSISSILCLTVATSFALTFAFKSELGGTTIAKHRKRRATLRSAWQLPQFCAQTAKWVRDWKRARVAALEGCGVWCGSLARA